MRSITVSNVICLVGCAGLFWACRSEVSLGTGQTEDPLLGTQGHPPKADGTCNVGLSVCGGVCTPTCDAIDAGAPPAADAGAPFDASTDAGTDAAPIDAAPIDAGSLPTSGVIASGLRKVFSIAVDDDNVYWAEDKDSQRASVNDPPAGKITKLSLHGGAPVDLALGQDGPVTIALTSTDVYWGTTGIPMSVAGGVYKSPIAGGARTTVVGAVASIDQVLIDNGALYWALQDFSFAGGMSGIYKGGLDGSGAAMVIDNSSLFMTFAVASGDVFMNTGGLVRSYDAVKGLSSSYFANDGNGEGVAIAASGASLVIVSGTGALQSSPVPLLNGAPITTVDPGPGGGVAFYSNVATDGTSAFWTSCVAATTTCTLYKERLTGGGATAIASHAGTLGTVALSPTFTYWGVDGAILRFPR